MDNIEVNRNKSNRSASTKVTSVPEGSLNRELPVKEKVMFSLEKADEMCFR